jgi:hypothetical protein
MRGLNDQMSGTYMEKKQMLVMNDFKQLLLIIVRQFLDLLTKNPLLGVESLFRV